MDYKTRAPNRPKIISIPVHFIHSSETQSASAVKIQKSFRGFFVRKCVVQIVKVLREVEEIEKRIESVKENGIDDKERIRVNETLMSLLFKLDGIRGICNGVRECRKRVIKKAIALQDKVDSIPKVADVRELKVNLLQENADSTATDVVVDLDFNAEGNVYSNGTDIVVDSELRAGTDTIGELDLNAEEIMTATMQENDDSTATAIEMKTIVPEEYVGASDCVPIQEEMMPLEDADLPVMDGVSVEEEEAKTIHCVIADDDQAALRERKRSRELLERMVEENEKLVGMVRELNEKSELQTRLLNSLVQRVEFLEKTVVCDTLARMKKKKKRNGNQKSC